MKVLKDLKVESPGPDQFPVVSFSGKECPLDKSLRGKLQLYLN